MPLSFVSGVGANADNVTLGTHAAGDVLLCFCGLEASATPPDLASGWTNIAAGASPDNVASRLAYKVAASGGETSGTWTNATAIIVVVYRSQHASDFVGGLADDFGGGTTLNYPGITLDVGDGTSWALLFGISSWGAGTLGTPTGTTSRATTADAFVNLIAADSNGGVASWSSTTGTNGGYDNWQTRVMELIAAAGGGGGGTPPPGNRIFILP